MMATNNGQDDIKINIGVNDTNAIAALTRLINSAKVKFAALATTVATAARSMIDKVSSMKLEVAIKGQTNKLNELASSLDNIIKKYDTATYKSERMANAVKAETSAQMQRLNAYKAMDAVSYEIWRRGQITPGMSSRQAFEKGAEIDAAQRAADIANAEKAQAVAERAAAADVEKTRADKEATDRKIAELRRLRAQVQVARDAIPNAEDMDFNFSTGFADNMRKARKRVDAAFARTFGTNAGTAAFWDNPEIQNFKGSYSELSQRLGGMITEAQRRSNTLGDELNAANANYANTRDTGRANIRLMRENSASIAADEARRFAYSSEFENEQRGAAIGDRARTVRAAELELEWKKRAETADRDGQKKILEERLRYYKELAGEERKLLEDFANKREETLNNEEKWRRDRAEVRLHSYEDTVRGIIEEQRQWEKRGGDVEGYVFRTSQEDREEQRAESLRGLRMRGLPANVTSAMDGTHWLGKLQDVSKQLAGIAVKYGAKKGKDGALDFSTMNFRALRNNEYDSAVFDRLQGKADAYRGNLASAAGNLIDADISLRSRHVENMASRNRLSAMGLGGGASVADFGKDTANNTRESNVLLRQILQVMEHGGNSATWDM